MILDCCIAQRVYSEVDQKRNLPKKIEEFKLDKQPFTLADTVIVSPNAVYVYADYLCGLKCDSMYFFIRFFNDGKIFWSFPYYSYPKEKEFNDLYYGKNGRYIVVDKKLQVEIFADKQSGIMYMFARPAADGIQFYKSTGRGLGKIMKVKRTTDGGFYRKAYTNLYNRP